MGDSILYYFVDTNLFFQCRPLDQLDWSSWQTFDEVRLIVSQPVLREIDYLKNKGNDRVAKRARSTSAMFRDILGTGEKLVHTTDPRVFLSIEPHHTYSESLTGQLNYQERDDQLIGTLYEFAQRNQTSDVRLFTRDTAPLFIAQSLNLTADIISDDWLLPPETTETEKKLKSLELENARLRKSEPSFSIDFLDQTGRDAEFYEASYTWFEPLTDAEVDELMQCLKDDFPLETDFGSKEPAERTVPTKVTNLLLGQKQKFIPATDEKIAEYRDTAYPQWLEQCEQKLRNHHRSLQRKSRILNFSFVAANHGTRPATDALITITATGDFHIKPSSPGDWDDGKDTEDYESDELKDEALPEPPTAPRGGWHYTSGIDISRISALATAGLASNILATTRRLSGIGKHASLANLAWQPPPHDANAFYYKPHRPSIPLESFSLECEQWRHDEGDESFCGEIHVGSKHADAKGALLCRIQAGNLSKSESKTIPVRIAVTHASAVQAARQMVECTEMVMT